MSSTPTSKGSHKYLIASARSSAYDKMLANIDKIRASENPHLQE